MLSYSPMEDANLRLDLLGRRPGRFIVLMLCLLASNARGQALEVAPEFQQGLREIRSGKFRQAIQTCSALQKAFPQHPLPSLIQTEAYWGMIYYQTGHITSSEIWNQADVKTSPYDADFQKSVEKSIELGERMSKQPQS